MDKWFAWASAVRSESGIGARNDLFGPMPARHQGRTALMAQDRGVRLTLDRILSWFPSQDVSLRVNEVRRRGGNIDGRLRPDVQFNNPQREGRRTHIEVDTNPRSMKGHIEARDRNARNVFLLFDPRTGALTRKIVYPRRAVHPRREAGPLQLRPDDVFDH